MTHCNDQLIDQLLTQAEQEGRCLIPPSTAIRKALLRRIGRHGRLPHAGHVRAQATLERAQPSATPLRDYPRPCDHPPRLDVLLVFGRLSAGARGLVATPERRACLQLDKAVGSSGRTYSAAPD